MSWLGSANSTRSRRALPSAAEPVSGRGDQIVACQSRSAGSARSARRKIRSARALLARDQHELGGASGSGRGVPRHRYRRRRPAGSPGSRPGRTAASARGSPRSWRCGRPGARTTAATAAARAVSTASARWARGSCRRSAPASGAGRRSTRWAQTARARGRCRAAGGQRLLDRPRDVDRQRRRPPPRGRERQHLADAEHQRLVRRRGRAATRAACGSPGGCRARARGLDGAMISTRWPRRVSSWETRAT